MYVANDMLTTQFNGFIIFLQDFCSVKVRKDAVPVRVSLSLQLHAHRSNPKLSPHRNTHTHAGCPCFRGSFNITPPHHRSFSQIFMCPVKMSLNVNLQEQDESEKLPQKYLITLQIFKYIQ